MKSLTSFKKEIKTDKQFLIILINDLDMEAMFRVLDNNIERVIRVLEEITNKLKEKQK